MRVIDWLVLFWSGTSASAWLNISHSSRLGKTSKTKKYLYGSDPRRHFGNDSDEEEFGDFYGYGESFGSTSFNNITAFAPYHQRSKRSVCSKDGPQAICDHSQGKVCIDGMCRSACSIKNLNRCTCPATSDDYCYLCCGDSRHRCAPAHTFNIYKPNGELWERPECAWCRKGGINRMGKQCDDNDHKKVCYNKKCNGALCAAAPEGQYCIQEKSTNKICAEGHCRDPCEPDMHMCECSIASIYRCELCCMDGNGKCQSAKENFHIQKKDGRPHPRSGLTCGRYDWTCNKYAQCFSPPSFHLPFLTIAMCLVATCLIHYLFSL